MEIIIIALCALTAYLAIGFVLVALTWGTERNPWIAVSWGYTAYKLVQSIKQKQKRMKKP